MFIYRYLDWVKLSAIDKHIAFSLSYGLEQLFQQRVDEEGSGAVFGAVKL